MFHISKEYQLSSYPEAGTQAALAIPVKEGVAVNILRAVNEAQAGVIITELGTKETTEIRLDITRGINEGSSYSQGSVLKNDGVHFRPRMMRKIALDNILGGLHRPEYPYKVHIVEGDKLSFAIFERPDLVYIDGYSNFVDAPSWRVELPVRTTPYRLFNIPASRLLIFG